MGWQGGLGQPPPEVGCELKLGRHETRLGGEVGTTGWAAGDDLHHAGSEADQDAGLPGAVVGAGRSKISLPSRHRQRGGGAGQGHPDQRAGNQQRRHPAGGCHGWRSSMPSLRSTPAPIRIACRRARYGWSSGRGKSVAAVRPHSARSGARQTAICAAYEAWTRLSRAMRRRAGGRRLP